MREKGFEPLRPKALDPKSSVSASFTTLACYPLIVEQYKPRKECKGMDIEATPPAV